MNVFCSRCGTAQEAANLDASIKCTSCGLVFKLGSNAPPPSASNGPIIAIVVVGIGIFSVVVIGILAAIAIPNFIKFQARAKQSEAKSNLKALYIAERSFAMEHDGELSAKLQDVPFHLERGNRYAYFLDLAGPMEARTGAQAEESPEATSIGVDLFRYADLKPVTARDVPHLTGEVGLQGKGPNSKLTAVAVGRLDGSGRLDVWSISTFDRTGARGETIPAGMPFNDVNVLDR